MQTALIRKSRYVTAFAPWIGFAIGMPVRLPAAGTEEGHKIFHDKYVGCHEDGTPNTPVGKALKAADLRSADVQNKPDAGFCTPIDQGKGNMPPFGSGLNKTQINQVIAHVRELGKKHATGTMS